MKQELQTKYHKKLLFCRESEGCIRGCKTDNEEEKENSLWFKMNHKQSQSNMWHKKQYVKRGTEEEMPTEALLY